MVVVVVVVVAVVVVVSMEKRKQKETKGNTKMRKAAWCQKKGTKKKFGFQKKARKNLNLKFSMNLVVEMLTVNDSQCFFISLLQLDGEVDSMTRA